MSHTRNGSVPVWQSITVAATGQASVSGYQFVPKTPEQFYHDADGNLTNDGRWTYTWDAENRLVKLAPGTAIGPQNAIQFEYDWRGRRIRKQVWDNPEWDGTPTNDVKFVYDGWNLIAILNSSFTLQTSFVWGSDLSGSIQGAGGVGGLLFICDQPSAIGYSAPAYDGNGNVMTLLSMSGGTNCAAYEYGPFGEVIRATGIMAKANPFRFSTKFQDDETDLLYYGYRYYNASTGKWLSRDLTEERGGINLYGLDTNDPIGKVDSLGLYAVLSEGFAFRDPWYWSLWGENTSKVQMSTAAHYSAWASPFRNSICNSWELWNHGGDPYPPDKTSFVKAYLLEGGCSRRPRKFQATCHATLTAFTVHRLSSKPPVFQALGTILGEKITTHETFRFPIASDGDAYFFSKTVSKTIVVDGQYTLYYVFMPLALQVQGGLGGGFVETGSADCTLSDLGEN